MHTMTKIAGANAIIVPYSFFMQELIAYEDYTGNAKTTYYDYTTERGHYTPRLENMEKAAMAHLGLWGTSFVLDILALTGIFPILAALWIEHVISNFNLAVVGYVAYLFWDADLGWAKVFAYVLQGLIMFALERF